jgi:hypothetical protein
MYKNIIEIIYKNLTILTKTTIDTFSYMYEHITPFIKGEGIYE